MKCKTFCEIANIITAAYLLVVSLIFPGHALEGGWFLLELAQINHDESLKQTAIDKFIVKPFNTGWDVKYGGLMYFMDVDG